jgi:hypothetical protein
VDTDTVISGDVKAFSLYTSMTDFTCGNINESADSGINDIAIGDCYDFILLGFSTFWVESEPPYLVDISPKLTVEQAYTTAQLTELATPLIGSWSAYATSAAPVQITEIVNR